MPLFDYLQQGAGGDKVSLHPVILPDVFNAFKNQVKTMLRREARGPEHHLQTYKKYEFLISRQVSIIFYSGMICVSILATDSTICVAVD